VVEMRLAVGARGWPDGEEVWVRRMRMSVRRS
jgi:hypothetical protein